MWWLFKKKEVKPPCKHQWELYDFYIYTDPYDCDTEKIFIITCDGCMGTRKVREYEFNQLKSLGMIKQN